MIELLQGDCLSVLKTLPDRSVQCCVTSPPYWGLRDYGVKGQLGLEETPEAYVEQMVAVFREVRRVLRDDGTLWLNLGDSYAGNFSSGNLNAGFNERYGNAPGQRKQEKAKQGLTRSVPLGLKPKDLVGIPWRVAFALQADGWYLRSDIIWAKPNPMPESVRDRPTKAHEYLFLLAKSERYFYDADAVREPMVKGAFGSRFDTGKTGVNGLGRVSTLPREDNPAGRNRRTVWTICPKPYKGAHFATFPPRLVEPCVLAGCPEGGWVLDPFMGSGTTGEVALTHGRAFVGIELNRDYLKLARKRLAPWLAPLKKAA